MIHMEAQPIAQIQDYARGCTIKQSYRLWVIPILSIISWTQLGELVALVFITLHRSPALEVILLHPVRRKPSCTTWHTSKQSQRSVFYHKKELLFIAKNQLSKLRVTFVSFQSFFVSTKSCYVLLWTLLPKPKSNEWQSHQVIYQMTDSPCPLHSAWLLQWALLKQSPTTPSSILLKRPQNPQTCWSSMHAHAHKHHQRWLGLGSSIANNIFPHSSSSLDILAQKKATFPPWVWP